MKGTTLNTVPIWEKLNLTINEAAEYSNIGINRLTELVSNPMCPFVLHVGNKRLIKRKEFEKYIEKVLEV
ncbi:MAG: excisionase family DNA-binding protein [Ruminococcaceae bacterium]|nr:excisionase family DNA-binding protein [Oscillospiraceae bacterium]